MRERAVVVIQGVLIGLEALSSRVRTGAHRPEAGPGKGSAPAAPEPEQAREDESAGREEAPVATAPSPVGVLACVSAQ